MPGVVSSYACTFYSGIEAPQMALRQVCIKSGRTLGAKSCCLMQVQQWSSQVAEQAQMIQQLQTRALAEHQWTPSGQHAVDKLPRGANRSMFCGI